MTVPTEPFLKLINEVFGLAAFEHEIREVIGNTNWNVLAERARDARAALPHLSAALAVEAGAGEIWHRADGSRGDVLLYTLRQDGWRKGKPVMVNDMMVRIERTNGSDTDVGSVVNRILSALTPASSAVEGEAVATLTRPIVGIENRTAQEVFDIMVDRIRLASPAPHQEGRADG